MAALPIQVNLIPGYDHVPPVVKLNQYEYGFTRQFEVYYGGVAYTIPSGSTVRIEGTKPDLTAYSYAASFSGNVITVTIKEQMTVLDGLHRAELVIIPSSSQRVSTINLRMDIEKGALSKSTPISETEIPAIVDAARSYALRAETAADGAEQSERAAAASEEIARNSATAAASSASNARTSELNAKTSETNAKESEVNSKAYETQTRDYKNAAEEAANRAEMYADLSIPSLRVDPITMELIESDDVDRLRFVYTPSNGQLSYELIA